MENKLSTRKSPRLKHFDYSTQGYYFVTICTEKHQQLFGKIKETKYNGEMQLNNIGIIVKKHIEELSTHYKNVSIDKYIVMPNHIHMIVILNSTATNLSNIIGLFKSGISREIGKSIWQRSFHDHIIRNEKDYLQICEYINNNPAKWATDNYYQP